jgi:hypothetical protein
MSNTLCVQPSIDEVTPPVSAAIEAADIDDAQLAQVLRQAKDAIGKQRSQQLSLDPENLRRGLGQLVLTLVRLLHEILERQAIRRIEGGSLTDKQIEDVGFTLMRQAEEIDRLTRELDLTAEDLNIDLGPIGRLF